MRRVTARAVLSALVATGAADARGASAPAGGAAARAPVRTVHAGVGTIAYRTVGHGRPLVLITGMTGTMNSWPPRFI
ncbi:MAG TPA: hypothetical protein VFR49_01525, partial [Solirubrobacteraceae bacterium]|nr:hypothetical protein [Solirubrobacteraceae bacterium]